MVIHGGPTTTAMPVLNVALQCWTSRGFAVVDVNYGGSTGYGRTYRELLRGAWGVADLEALAADTHKFESRYLDGLIGKYPEQRDVYVARSPINQVHRFSRPLIVLQGLQDEVVPRTSRR